MHYLLLIGAFLFFAFIAPLKTTVTLVAVVLTVSLVVKVSTQVIGNVTPTLAQAFRAVAYSLFFVGVAMFTLGSFSAGTGISKFTGVAVGGVLAALFLVYSLGFKVGLGTTLGVSGAVAFVSTLASGALLWLASKAS
jgi:hypothetical protein